MSFAIIVALLLLTIVTFIYNKAKTGVVLVGLNLVWIFLIGSGQIPNFLMKDLQFIPPLISPDWKEKNAIVVLGAGTTRWPEPEYVRSTLYGYSRIHEAARLYYACKKAKKICKILASGGDPLKNNTSEAEVMARGLKEVGVSETDLILESKSNNTFQNAQFSSVILQAQSFDQTLLVTSGTHMSRSLLYFSHFHVQAKPAPSDQADAISSLIPFSYNFMLTDLSYHELSGILRYYFYNFMGWNKKK